MFVVQVPAESVVYFVDGFTVHMEIQEMVELPTAERVLRLTDVLYISTLAMELFSIAHASDRGARTCTSTTLTTVIN